MVCHLLNGIHIHQCLSSNPFITLCKRQISLANPPLDILPPNSSLKSSSSQSHALISDARHWIEENDSRLSMTIQSCDFLVTF